MQRSMREFYDDPLQRSAVLDALHRDGSVRDFELRFKRADGRRIWVSASFREIVYRGEVRLYAGLVDITSTKEAQESLKAERRLLKRLLDLHDRDRQLIAYEIHDGMVQDMTGSAMFVETAQTALPAGDPAAANIANGLKLLRGAIDEARRMINGLRPPILEETPGWCRHWRTSSMKWSTRPISISSSSMTCNLGELHPRSKWPSTGSCKRGLTTSGNIARLVRPSFDFCSSAMKCKSSSRIEGSDSIPERCEANDTASGGFASGRGCWRERLELIALRGKARESK